MNGQFKNPYGVRVAVEDRPECGRHRHRVPDHLIVVALARHHHLLCRNAPQRCSCPHVQAAIVSGSYVVSSNRVGRSQDEVTFGGGTKADGLISNRMRVSQRH